MFIISVFFLAQLDAFACSSEEPLDQLVAIFIFLVTPGRLDRHPGNLDRSEVN